MAAGYNLTLLPGKRPVGPVSAIGESARKKMNVAGHAIPV
jgi:hypothetical protein